MREFAERFTAEAPRLDVLVDNAGALTQERELSTDGIEVTLTTNVIGPFCSPNVKGEAMARYQASIDTSWTAEEAFAYLSDFSTSAEWDPGIVEAERVGAGAAGEGTEFRLVAEFLGRRTSITYRVVEYEPPRAVTFLGENATVVSHDRIALETTATGTRVTYDAELRLKGLLRVADPLLGLALGRVGDRALVRLREVLAHPASGTVDAAA